MQATANYVKFTDLRWVFCGVDQVGGWLVSNPLLLPQTLHQPIQLERETVNPTHVHKNTEREKQPRETERN